MNTDYSVSLRTGKFMGAWLCLHPNAFKVLRSVTTGAWVGAEDDGEPK